MSDESVETFGIVDVVEAFTAMRHDLKLQSKEGRKLLEAVEQAVTRMERIAEQSQSQAAADAGSSASKAFADAVAEIDETVQRTVDAAAVWIETQGTPADESSESVVETIERLYRQQPAWVRWAAGGFREQLLAATEPQQHRLEEGLNATLEGLQLMQQRVRKLTDNCKVQRVDVLGKLFDPNQMNALEAVSLESVSHPSGVITDDQAEPLRSGEVIEQLRPAYYWNDALLRYAQVRIAR